jgi:hypothetical protein
MHAIVAHQLMFVYSAFPQQPESSAETPAFASPTNITMMGSVQSVKLATILANLVLTTQRVNLVMLLTIVI